MLEIAEKIKPSTTSEEDILQAARAVFTRKGLHASKMQEIADEAGISRTLLHYYYRSKEHLFEAVFQDTFTRIVPMMKQIVHSADSLQIKIERFVEFYLNLIIENPFYPAFMIHELSTNPSKVLETFTLVNIDFGPVIQQFNNEMEAGHIRPDFNFVHFAENLVGLCFFPFLSRPILDEFFFDRNPQAFNQFIEERKKVVMEIMIKTTFV